MKKTVSKPKFNPMTVRSSQQLASTLKRIRKINGFSQTALAKKAGLTQAAISRIEGAANEKVEIKTLFLLFAALNADIVVTSRSSSNESISIEGLL